MKWVDIGCARLFESSLEATMQTGNQSGQVCSAILRSRAVFDRVFGSLLFDDGALPSSAEREEDMVLVLSDHVQSGAVLETRP